MAQRVQQKGCWRYSAQDLQFVGVNARPAQHSEDRCPVRKSGGLGLVRTYQDLARILKATSLHWRNPGCPSGVSVALPPEKDGSRHGEPRRLPGSGAGAKVAATFSP